MHFQLPKPLHGWREFLGEVGIIVIGVLIALGGEQVVESWHWKHVAAEARESVGEEVNNDIFWASEMAIAQPCVDQQLQQIESAVLAPGTFHPVTSYFDGQTSFVFRAPARLWSTSIWQSVSSDGTAAHFDRKTEIELASTYALVAYVRERKFTADQLRERLTALSRPIQPDAGTRANLVADIEQDRSLYQTMALVSDQIVGRAENAGFKLDARGLQAHFDRSGTLNFCRDHHLPLGTVRPAR